MQPIKAARYKVLDELGIEEIAARFVGGQTVRSICKELFTPRKKGEVAGTSEFYAWLKARDHGAAWREAKIQKGHVVADTAVDLSMAAGEKTVRSTRLKVDTLRWQASKLNPSEYGDKLEIGVSAGQSWLEALEQLSASKEVETIQATVLDEEGGGSD